MFVWVFSPGKQENTSRKGQTCPHEIADKETLRGFFIIEIELNPSREQTQHNHGVNLKPQG